MEIDRLKETKCASVCLSTSVCLCLPLFVSVCLRLPTSVSVRLCLSLSVTVYLCLTMYVSVCLCLPLSDYVCLCLLMAWRGMLRVTVTNLGVDTPDRPDFVASVRRRVPERVHAPSSSHLTPCLLILSKHLNTSQDFRMIPILGWCTTLILGDDSENSAVCFPNSW